MTLPATDTFTGSNGTALTTYSSNWTLNKGNFDIQTNAIAPNVSVTEDAAHWNADTFDDDQYAQGTLLQLGSAYVHIGVSVRCIATAGVATYYSFYSDSTDGAYLQKFLTGTGTVLGSKSSPLAANDVIRLEASGTTITPLKNGSQTGTPGAQTDESITSGYAGLAGWDNGETVRLDSWEGGNLVSAALDQLAYRWRNDDGSESGASWAGDENADLTTPAAALRVRVQIDNTGDAAAIVPRWEWRINAGTWRIIK